MTDHYLEQLRHQLAQTRAELRRAEDELAVHRQRASRETRLRLAWQSARRRANWQRAILADYRTEAVARTMHKASDTLRTPDQHCCVCGTTENGGHAFYENYQGRLFCGRCANGDRPSQQGAQEHECRVWEDEGEWNVSCLACDAYVDNVGNETDAEEWAEDHLEFGNQACGCWHSGCGHTTTETQP